MDTWWERSRLRSINDQQPKFFATAGDVQMLTWGPLPRQKEQIRGLPIDRVIAVGKEVWMDMRHLAWCKLHGLNVKENPTLLFCPEPLFKVHDLWSRGQIAASAWQEQLTAFFHPLDTLRSNWNFTSSTMSVTGYYLSHQHTADNIHHWSPFGRFEYI